MGVLTPKPVEIGELLAARWAFFAATIKTVGDTKIGDTVTDDIRPPPAQLPGFEDIKPMVFAGLYTVDSHSTRCCATHWKSCGLNDSSFFFEPESSVRAGLRLPLRLFSACYTWRSSRSDWSASTSWT